MEKLNLDRLDTMLAGGRYHNHKDLMAFPDCGRKDPEVSRMAAYPEAGVEWRYKYIGTGT